jgi:hypothetical protein
MVCSHIQIYILPPPSGWLNLIQMFVIQYTPLKQWNKPHLLHSIENQKTATAWTSLITTSDTGLMLQNFLTSITKLVTHLHLWFVLCWDFWLSFFQHLFLGHVSFLHCWHWLLPSTVLQLVLKYWNRSLTYKSHSAFSRNYINIYDYNWFFRYHSLSVLIHKLYYTAIITATSRIKCKVIMDS